ncbi:MAG: response regulator [Candidatus Omnitrophica bacterium]|nr:response regulator [Candidatus Omnitrophota bacterium]
MPDKKRILIVDDEMQLVEMVKIRLEANGYETLAAYDGQTGLNMAKKEKPDLIILDLMMPKMDGYKVCALLKRDSRYSKIPVLIFTAKAQEEDAKMSEEAGADAYLVKPFEPEALLGKISGLLKE